MELLSVHQEPEAWVSIWGRGGGTPFFWKAIPSFTPTSSLGREVTTGGKQPCEMNSLLQSPFCPAVEKFSSSGGKG